MGDYISSSKEIADDYANRIAESVSYLDPSSLDGVDDDNTLAESGLYSSYYYLKSMLEQFKQTMRVEAANLRSAASAINEADSASMGNFASSVEKVAKSKTQGEFDGNLRKALETLEISK